MGTCSSIQNITINLDQENLIYFTDEIISGTIYWNLEKHIHVQEISITFTGEIGYTTTHTERDTNGNSSNVMDYHHEQFYSIKLPLVKSSMEENKFVLSPQTYSWSFQFPLINHLPPTLNKPQSYPHVRYYLEVNVVKSNQKTIKYVTVYPRNNLLQNPQCLLSNTYANFNQEYLSLRCTMNKLGYIPGEFFEFMLEINNQNHILIKCIDLFVFQFYEIKYNQYRNLVFQTTLPNILNFKNQHIQDAFSIPVSFIPLPPSCQYHGGIQTYITIQHYYQLRLEVRTDHILSHIHIDIPIIIGTKAKLDFNVQDTSNFLIQPSAPTLEQILFNNNDDV